MRSLYAMPGDDRHPNIAPPEPDPKCAVCGHSEGADHYFDEGGWRCWECFCNIQDRIFDTARECVELRARLDARSAAKVRREAV